MEDAWVIGYKCVFIYEVSAQKPSQLVLDGATELIHINWRQSIPQPGSLLKYNCGVF